MAFQNVEGEILVGVFGEFMAKMMIFEGDFCGMSWRGYFLGGTSRGVLEEILMSFVFLESNRGSVVV